MRIAGLILVLLLAGCNPKPGNFFRTPDGIRLYFNEYSKVNTPTLLFVTGWSADHTAWDDQIHYFKDKYNVIVLDLPGFGHSGENRKLWTIEQYGNDIAELSNYLQLNDIFLIGHSLGGPVVLEAAIKMQENVRGIVLVDILQDPHYKYDSSFVINYVDNYAHNFKNYEYHLKYHRNDSSLTNRYMHMLPPGDKVPESWFLIWFEVFRWIKEDCVDVISELEIPVRGIYSDRFEIATTVWNTYVDDFEARVIDNSGHFLNWEYPDEFNDLLNEIIIELKEK